MVVESINPDGIAASAIHSNTVRTRGDGVAAPLSSRTALPGNAIAHAATIATRTTNPADHNRLCCLRVSNGSTSKG